MDSDYRYIYLQFCNRLFGYIAMHMSNQLSQGDDYSGPHNVLLTGGILGAILVLCIITKIAHLQIEQMQSERENKELS